MEAHAHPGNHRDRIGDVTSSLDPQQDSESQIITNSFYSRDTKNAAQRLSSKTRTGKNIERHDLFCDCYSSRFLVEPANDRRRCASDISRRYVFLKKKRDYERYRRMVFFLDSPRLKSSVLLLENFQSRA